MFLKNRINGTLAIALVFGSLALVSARDQEVSKFWQNYQRGDQASAMESLASFVNEAKLAWNQGQFDQRSPDTYEAIIEKLEIAREIYLNQGSSEQLNETELHLARFLLVARRSGELQILLMEAEDRADEGRGGLYLAAATASLLDQDVAMDFVDKAIEHFHFDGDVDGELQALALKGIALMKLGQWEDGLSVTLKAQSESARFGSSDGYYATLVAQATYYNQMGDAQFYKEALIEMSPSELRYFAVDNGLINQETSVAKEPVSFLSGLDPLPPPPPIPKP